VSSYRLVTYKGATGPHAGIVLGAEYFDAAVALKSPAYASVQGILDNWDVCAPQLDAFAKGKQAGGMPLVSAELLSPIPHPGTIYCAGANYADHMANMAKKLGIPPERDPHELGLSPWHFIKSSACVVGTRNKVNLECNFLDWEAELGVVIGKRARNIGLAQAFDHVAGYTIGNDLSARDRTARDKVDISSPFRFDWIGQKNFDGACPLGPWIVPRDEIKDAQALGIRTFVNDQIKQNSNTSKMLFTIAEQVSYLSTRITLHPGDVVLTGTPAGVGAETGECLKMGDVVRVEIDGLGDLVTQIV
jgi:2-keto-4-pentenoate hydratase/2-oxohepta-3-ene-1,7-dioic acid hydratase in catechol pathway